MKLEIIQTEEYLLAVREGHVQLPKIIKIFGNRVVNKNDDVNLIEDAEIIAHLPLNNFKPLEGVPLLPELEDSIWSTMDTAPIDGTFILIYDEFEKDINKAAWMVDADVTGKGSKRWCVFGTYGDEQGYYMTLDNPTKWMHLPDKKGYKAAVGYTEEDMRRAISMSRITNTKNVIGTGLKLHRYTDDEIIESLKPTPIAFEADTISMFMDENDVRLKSENNIIQGKYIYK